MIGTDAVNRAHARSRRKRAQQRRSADGHHDGARLPDVRAKVYKPQSHIVLQFPKDH
jgi:hypothetical protein